MASCPSSETLGVCNGYGVCDFAKHSCECNAIGAYKEKDGNCYPTCLLLQNVHWFCLVSFIYVLSDDDIRRALVLSYMSMQNPCMRMRSVWNVTEPGPDVGWRKDWSN